MKKILIFMLTLAIFLLSACAGKENNRSEITSGAERAMNILKEYIKEDGKGKIDTSLIVNYYIEDDILYVCRPCPPLFEEEMYLEIFGEDIKYVKTLYYDEEYSGIWYDCLELQKYANDKDLLISSIDVSPENRTVYIATCYDDKEGVESLCGEIFEDACYEVFEFEILFPE